MTERHCSRCGIANTFNHGEMAFGFAKINGEYLCFRDRMRRENWRYKTGIEVIN